MSSVENEESICPICGSTLVEKVIDYSDWNDGHLLVVRMVPVRECEAMGHRFFHAKVARSLEKIFQSDNNLGCGILISVLNWVQRCFSR